MSTEEPPPEDVPPESAEPGRRYPSTIGGAFYLAVLAFSVVGVAVVVVGDWRTGIRIVAGALVTAAVTRLALPDKDAGMLAVRSRPLDALLLGGTGVVLFILSASIPNQPGGP